jgi:hypothetical protein
MKEHHRIRFGTDAENLPGTHCDGRLDGVRPVNDIENRLSIPI